MSMTQSDREFLHTAALERIQFHYEAHQDETKADRERLAALEKPYQNALAHLSTKEVKAIHDFHELSFNMSADSELMLYKCGVLDGLRLAKLLLELE